jgi:hypothetical protein
LHPLEDCRRLHCGRQLLAISRLCKECDNKLGRVTSRHYLTGCARRQRRIK